MAGTAVDDGFGRGPGDALPGSLTVVGVDPGWRAEPAVGDPHEVAQERGVEGVVDVDGVAGVVAGRVERPELSYLLQVQDGAEVAVRQRVEASEQPVVGPLRMGPWRLPVTREEGRVRRAEVDGDVAVDRPLSGSRYRNDSQYSL